jgi:hypothetical protein
MRLRIDCVVAIAAAVAYPARLAAVRHRDRHETARRFHVSKRSLLRDGVDAIEQDRRFVGREPAQNDRAWLERLAARGLPCALVEQLLLALRD